MKKQIMQVAALMLCTLPAMAQTSVQRSDHKVTVQSTAPATSGKPLSLYVREVVTASASEKIPVLFVHGAGTPAEVAFDVPLEGHSWMAYLAQRGFITYATDMTGYGRSTRPSAMENRCNLGEEPQKQEFGDSCPATTATALTTVESDWHDIDAVVDFIRKRHHVDKVHLVGWSQGGPRTLGYAHAHPDKIANVVVLAPAYNRQAAAKATEALLAGAAVTKQSQQDFLKQWDGQAPCSGQYEPVVADAVWRQMLASDPVGAKWGSGVRRAPRVPTFGWTPTEVAATQTPVLMVTGQTDGQVNPQRVRELYADIGSTSKVLVELACASHNAMWEHGAERLFDASYQWLHGTAYRGSASGSFVLASDLPAGK
ncbi:MAG TPA: alpha/beta fold hydrolase [Candidatus Acidoferrum sp.]|nr:alpha/beta fold hydrolase [Candidatus Acidoferrum sp.]